MRITIPTVGAYYVEPSTERTKSGIFRVYGPFRRELDAFRAAFFMRSREDLYGSKTEEFARLVASNVTYHEPGEIAYVFRDDGWHEMGYKGARFLSNDMVPVYPSWRKEAHSRELGESHVLNNAMSAGILSRNEGERLYEQWRQAVVAKGLL